MCFLVIMLFFSGFDIVLAANTTYTQLVDIHPSSFKCGHDLHSSLSRMFKLLPFAVFNDDIGKVYVNNDTKFSPPHKCPQISDECHDNFNHNSELLGQLEEISQFIDVFNSAFSNCYHVFKKNSSAPSGYYMMRAANGSLISVYCDLSFRNCSQILHVYSSAPSGYYTIQAPNGSLIPVYCDMEGSNCDGKGGWMRVGYINMSEPNATCPSGLNSYFFPNINYPLCDRPHPSNGGCNSTIFSTFGLNCSQVCGQIRGYHRGNVDGIYDNNHGSPSLEGAYVDGVSITHGNNPRHHIWTYIVGQKETSITQWDCPCNNGSTETIPQYVGDDYYCESGVSVSEAYTLHYNDPLWDGIQCNYLEFPCCTSPNMPWFVKSLNQSTIDDIELRMCTSEGYPDESTPVDIIELYVR